MSRILEVSVAVGVGLAGFVALVPASADVPRYQMQTVTLTVPIEYQNLIYPHFYTLTLNPCDETLSGSGGPGFNNRGETTFGSLSGDILTYTSTYNGPLGVGWDAPYIYTATIDITTGNGTWSDNGGAPGPVESGTITGAIDSVVDQPPIYRNHGAFVSAQPDKNDAAHSCIGMPINSNKNK